MTLQMIFLIGLIVFSALAILSRDLIKAAISFAAASLMLGLVFFRLGAPYAGVFEISVVAGLITVLFMLTIALTEKQAEVRESPKARMVFPFVFIAFIIIDVLVMRGLIRKIPTLPTDAETGLFGQVLWGQRTFDLVGQVAVILAAVFAVLALFRKKDHDD